MTDKGRGHNVPTDKAEQEAGVKDGSLVQESTGGKAGIGNDRDNGQRLGRGGESEGDAPTTSKW